MSFSKISGLRRLNRTELYQVCQGAGINVHPGHDREALIGMLIGELEQVSLDRQTHPIDSWRAAIISFLSDHWVTLEPQIKCPAKDLKNPHNPNPNPCFGCLDTQVVTCVVNNTPRVETLIASYRSKEWK